MRQTDLSPEELFAQFNSPVSYYPKCLIVNEIGEVCKVGNKEAETFLRNLLNEGSTSDKLIAFSWLSVTENIDQETSEALDIFKKNPGNGELVERAEEAIRMYRARCN